MAVRGFLTVDNRRNKTSLHFQFLITSTLSKIFSSKSVKVSDFSVVLVIMFSFTYVEEFSEFYFSHPI